MHLYGEAGRVLAAGVGAVSSRPEGSCTGALRRLYYVMVYPLTPLHQQVGQSGVQRDVVIVSEQHLLRHQPHLDNKQTSVGATAADRPEDEWALLLDSYWRQSGVMVGALWVPASGRPPRILILRRQPAGIRDVCSPPSGMLSKQDKNTTDTQLSKNNKNLIEIEHVATCVLALTCCCTLLWWICNAQTDSRSHSWVSAAQRSSPSPAADSPCRLHSAALWEQTVNITPKSYK